MKLKNYVLVTLVSALFGCVSQPTSTTSFEDELYDGRSVESFKLADVPKTEKEAIERGDKALSQNKTDLALYEYIRSLKLPTGQYKDKTLYTIGRIHQSRHNLVLAEKAYLMALDANPDNVLVLEKLGANYSRQGDVVQGKRYFLRAINADQLRRGATKTMLNEPLSVQVIDGVTVDKDSPSQAYMGLGILYDVEVNHALAQSFFRQALHITPRSYKCLVNMGYSYYMSGHYEEAERTTLAALNIEKTDEKAQNNLALIYLAQNKPLKALNMFKTHMDEPQALNNVGYFLILHGKPAAAVPFLQQAIDKNPSYYKLANENLERALAEIKMKSEE